MGIGWAKNSTLELCLEVSELMHAIVHLTMDFKAEYSCFQYYNKQLICIQKRRPVGQALFVFCLEQLTPESCPKECNYLFILVPISSIFPAPCYSCHVKLLEIINLHLINIILNEFTQCRKTWHWPNFRMNINHPVNCLFFPLRACCVWKVHFIRLTEAPFI